MTASTEAGAIPGYVAGTWEIDPVHSEVGFTARHMMVSKVRGRFTIFSGELVTGEKLLDSSVTATIDLTSINTGNEQRDQHIRSADFFEVDKYTTMTYRSTGLRAEGDHYILDGELTLKDVTKAGPAHTGAQRLRAGPLRRHAGRLHRDRGDQPPRLRRELQRPDGDRRRGRERQDRHPARDRGCPQGLSRAATAALARPGSP